MYRRLLRCSSSNKINQKRIKWVTTTKTTRGWKCLRNINWWIKSKKYKINSGTRSSILKIWTSTQPTSLQYLKVIGLADRKTENQWLWMYRDLSQLICMTNNDKSWSNSCSSNKLSYGDRYKVLNKKYIRIKMLIITWDCCIDWCSLDSRLCRFYTQVTKTTLCFFHRSRYQKFKISLKLCLSLPDLSHLSNKAGI